MASFIKSLIFKLLQKILRRWHWLCALLIAVGLFWAGVQNPLNVIRAISPFLPFSLVIKKGAKWTSFSSLRIEGIELGEFSRIEAMELDWQWADLLLQGRIESILLDSPQVWTGKLKEAFPQKDEQGDHSKQMAFAVTTIKIKHGDLFLENIIPKVTLKIPLGRSTPFVLQNFQWGDTESKMAQTVQQLLSSEVILYSPFDATSPVLSFQEIKIDFTLQELAHQKIQRLKLGRPVLYIGPDLFWFLEQFQKNQKKEAPLPWEIEHLEIESAGLTINGFGNPGMKIPLYISKNLEKVRTDQWGEVFKKNQFEVDKGDRFYPSYGLKIYQFDGRIEFGLPVTEENSVNQVITLKATSLEWKKLHINEPWVSVTFDSRGVFGKIGGKAYGGYLAGECAIFFKAGFPWTASLHGEGLQVEEPVAKLAEDHFRMTGVMNVDIQAAAKSTVFEKSAAKIWFTGGGKMVIPAIDDLLQKLPPTWSPLKKQMTTIGLEAFKTFDYTSGTFNLKYDPVKSEAIMDLKGKQGRRRFQVEWTQD